MQQLWPTYSSMQRNKLINDHPETARSSKWKRAKRRVNADSLFRSLLFPPAQKCIRPIKKLDVSNVFNSNFALSFFFEGIKEKFFRSRTPPFAERKRREAKVLADEDERQDFEKGPTTLNESPSSKDLRNLSLSDRWQRISQRSYDGWEETDGREIYLDVGNEVAKVKSRSRNSTFRDFSYYRSMYIMEMSLWNLLRLPTSMKETRYFDFKGNFLSFLSLTIVMSS